MFRQLNNATVAQPVEQLIRNQQVTSSNLVSSSKQKNRFMSGFFVWSYYYSPFVKLGDLPQIICSVKIWRAWLNFAFLHTLMV